VPHTKQRETAVAVPVVPHSEVTMVVDTARGGRCIARPAPVVEMKRWSPSSHAKTGQCIVAIVTSRKGMVGVAQTTDRAGSL